MASGDACQVGGVRPRPATSESNGEKPSATARGSMGPANATTPGSVQRIIAAAAKNRIDRLKDFSAFSCLTRSTDWTAYTPPGDLGAPRRGDGQRAKQREYGLFRFRSPAGACSSHRAS